MDILLHRLEGLGHVSIGGIIVDVAGVGLRGTRYTCSTPGAQVEELPQHRERDEGENRQSVVERLVDSRVV